MAEDKHIVFSYGRMNPPTAGHSKVVDKVKSHADSIGANHAVIVSHSQNNKTDPLHHEHKKEYLKYESVTVPNESNLEIIDLPFFKKVNTQFSGLNDSEIIKFICENKNECIYTINHRNLYENYDWNQYLIDYPDLKITIVTNGFYKPFFTEFKNINLNFQIFGLFKNLI